MLISCAYVISSGKYLLSESKESSEHGVRGQKFVLRYPQIRQVSPGIDKRPREKIYI